VALAEPRLAALADVLGAFGSTLEKWSGAADSDQRSSRKRSVLSSPGMIVSTPRHQSELPHGILFGHRELLATTDTSSYVLRIALDHLTGNGKMKGRYKGSNQGLVRLRISVSTRDGMKVENETGIEHSYENL
jgi:hypothetical protein